MMSNENIFSSMGELWECGICTLLVLSKNKINFKTPLKDTTSLVIINLKICDSAEKLNLLSLDQPIKNIQRQCRGNCVSVTRTEKLTVYWLWFLKVGLCHFSLWINHQVTNFSTNRSQVQGNLTVCPVQCSGDRVNVTRSESVKISLNWELRNWKTLFDFWKLGCATSFFGSTT